MIKPHYQEQIGDYVLELPSAKAMWLVRMAGADQSEFISQHDLKSEARAAVKRYQAADRRRASIA